MKKSLTYQLLLFLFIPVIIMGLIQTKNISDIVSDLETERQIFFDNTIKSVSNRINDNITNIFKTTTTFSYSKYVQKYLEPTTSEKEKNTLRIYINELVQLSRKYNFEMVDVMLTNSTGVESLVGYYNKDIKELIIEKTLNRQPSDSNKKQIYFLDVVSQNSTTNYLIYSVPVFPIHSNTNSFDVLGYVSVVCTTKSIYQDICAYNNIVFEVFDNTNNVICISGMLEQNQIANSISTVKNNSLTTKTQKIGNSNLSIRGALIGQNNFPTWQQNIGYLVLWALFIVFFVIYIWIVTALLIIKPIRRINTEVSLIGDVNLNQRVSYSSNNEIGSLVVHINNMLDKIYTLNKKIFTTQSNLYESEIEKSKSQLYAFRSQVNPHFLFNTLQCIRSKALIANEDEIANMCVGISQILRYGISKEDIVTIDKELSIVKKYLSIIHIRFQNKITYEINVQDEGYLQYQIPKMILQPLVENSIIHGLEPMHSKGNIKINISADETLNISIVDNGIGIGKKQLESISRELNNSDNYFSNSRSENIGLLNVHNRIRLHFGSKYGLSITSTGQGTAMLIRLPK